MKKPQGEEWPEEPTPPPNEIVKEDLPFIKGLVYVLKYSLFLVLILVAFVPAFLIWICTPILNHLVNIMEKLIEKDDD